MTAFAQVSVIARRFGTFLPPIAHKHHSNLAEIGKLCQRNSIIRPVRVTVVKKGLREMPLKALKVTKGGRPYAEAFPTLNLLTVEAKWRQGITVCQWTNDAGVIVGHVEVTSLDTRRLVMRNHFFGAVNVGKAFRPTTVLLRWDKRRQGEDRAVMICPSCQRACEKIVLVASAWGCKVCHQLCNVKTRLTTGAAVHARKMKQLENIVKRGRRKGQHQSKFDKIKDEYGKLFWHFHNFPLPPELGYFQEVEWLKSGDNRVLDDITDAQWEDYGWSPGGRGGFQRLHWLAERNLSRNLTNAEIKRHVQARDVDFVRRSFAEDALIPAPKQPDLHSTGTPSRGWAVRGAKKRAFGRIIGGPPIILMREGPSWFD